MIIPLTEKVDSRLTAEDATLHLALGLFVDQRVTLGQAAEVAGISQSEFLRELGGRRISVHYDESDALADIATVGDWQQP